MRRSRSAWSALGAAWAVVAAVACDACDAAYSVDQGGASAGGGGGGAGVGEGGALADGAVSGAADGGGASDAAQSPDAPLGATDGGSGPPAITSCTAAAISAAKAKGITVVFCDDFDQGMLSTQWDTSSSGTGSSVALDLGQSMSAPASAKLSGAGYRVNANDAAVAGSAWMSASPVDDAGSAFTVAFDVEVDESAASTTLARISLPDMNLTTYTLSLSSEVVHWNAAFAFSGGPSDAAPFAHGVFHHVSASVANELITVVIDGAVIGIFPIKSSGLPFGTPILEIELDSFAGKPSTNASTGVITPGETTHVHADNVVITTP